MHLMFNKAQKIDRKTLLYHANPNSKFTSEIVKNVVFGPENYLLRKTEEEKISDKV